MCKLRPDQLESSERQIPLHRSVFLGFLFPFFLSSMGLRESSRKPVGLCISQGSPEKQTNRMHMCLEVGKPQICRVGWKAGDPKIADAAV